MMKRLAVFLLLFASSAHAMAPMQVATVTPAYQAPGWTGWTPASLGSAEKGFWTADDHGTARMTDDGSGLISSWSDQVNAIALTGTTAARPTWSASAVTSPSSSAAVPGVTFDGSANCLTSTSFAALPVGSTAGEIWISTYVSSATLSAKVPISYGNTSAGSRDFKYDSSGGRIRLLVEDGTASLNALGPQGMAGAHVAGGNWSGTTQAGNADGGPQAAGAISSLNTQTNKFRFGSNDAASCTAFFPGALRMVVITSTLANADHDRMAAYLEWDMGTPYNLPPNHPYRYRKP